MITFPEVFTNENFQYTKDENTKAVACADGLTGWGNCMAGVNPPKNFGEGMIKIGIILQRELDNKGATPDVLMEISKLFTKKN